MISLGNNILESKMRYHYNMMRLVFFKVADNLVWMTFPRKDY